MIIYFLLLYNSCKRIVLYIKLNILILIIKGFIKLGYTNIDLVDITFFNYINMYLVVVFHIIDIVFLFLLVI